jgi:anti-sigma B factor antagonist
MLRASNAGLKAQRSPFLRRGERSTVWGARSFHHGVPVIDSSSTFRVTTRPYRDRMVIVAHGEIDLATVSVIDQEVQDLRARGFKEIVLDLRGVTFMDSTGVRLLLQLDAESRSDGFSFSIIDAEGPVRRVLMLTGVQERLSQAEAPA